MRATTAQIELLASRVHTQLRIAGYIPRESSLDLEYGSPSAGRAWRLYYNEKGSSACSTIEYPGLNDGWPNMGYLGWTKGEALEKLERIHDGLSAEISSRGLKFGQWSG